MSCSVISEDIKIVMNSSIKQEKPRPRANYSSALQNPDISRVQLAALLRRRNPAGGENKSRRTFWSAFMANVVDSHANGNGEKTA